MQCCTSLTRLPNADVQAQCPPGPEGKSGLHGTTERGLSSARAGSAARHPRSCSGQPAYALSPPPLPQHSTNGTATLAPSYHHYTAPFLHTILFIFIWRFHIMGDWDTLMHISLTTFTYTHCFTWMFLYFGGGPGNRIDFGAHHCIMDGRIFMYLYHWRAWRPQFRRKRSTHTHE